MGATRGSGGSAGGRRPGAPAGWAQLAAEAARDLGRLVLPVECAGCGAVDEVLCGPCRRLLAGTPQRCEWSAPRLDRMNGRPPLPVWALTPYTGPVRELVVAWKDHGRADLTGALTDALAAAAAAVALVLLGTNLQPMPLLVVPAPSSGPARRRRGADLIGQLAAAVAGSCSATGLPARAAPGLAQRRGTRDQVGLGVRARGRNVTASVQWRPRAPLPVAGQPILLVDDVLTTGATLAACERALERVGGVVVGALTLAVTPPPGGWAATAALVRPNGRTGGWMPPSRRVTVGLHSHPWYSDRDAVVTSPRRRSLGPRMSEEVMSPDRP